VADGGTYAPNKAADTQIAGKDASKQLATPGTISKVKSLTAGLSIPVMEDPTILFELISGGDIPLVEFDSGPLSLGFQFQKSFGPIYAPPPVMMVIGGGASVTLRIAAGFDTYGIRRAIETGDGAQVLDSLYFKTVDNNGVPIPVVQFTGYLEAGASVSIGILEVGVVGGIKLTVGFYWNDPNGDGKFRLFEFGAGRGQQPDLPVQRRGSALSLHQGFRRDRLQPVLGELRLHAGQHQAARLQLQAGLHPAAAQAGRHPRGCPLRLRRQVRRGRSARQRRVGRQERGGGDLGDQAGPRVHRRPG
jgi:hypothetical protein